jgi:cytochrome b
MMTEYTPDSTSSGIKVWDAFIRTFHWSLASGCLLAFLSGEFHWPVAHQWIGYGLCLLILARVYWGFHGSRYARFRSFFFSLGETRAYIQSKFTGHPKHYLGHNPAGALMVFALLILISAILASGLLTLSVIDFEGPLLFLANRVSDEASYLMRDVHQTLPYLGLILVGLHLLGVWSGSWLHHENLVRAMLTGYKPYSSPNDDKEHS